MNKEIMKDFYHAGGMIKRHVTLLTIILMASLAWGQNPVVKVEGGLVQGILSASNEVTVFRGIPYAAPPVGDLRWKRPQPVIKWNGIKVADTFSHICWQPGNAVGTFYGNEFYWKEQTIQSEDCLYLNIWTPTKAIGNPDSKLPVAFWVHGGAYFNGYGHEITMDGDAWAKRDVILVTINYRLGIFGFLAHPKLSAESLDGTSGNYGTYDQVAALKWVYDNIAQFGGDPQNITVLGQSAGAASIKNLVSSPLSKDMIKNAVIQSGGGIGAFGSSDDGQAQAEAIGKKFMDKFGYRTLNAMRAVPAEELLKIFKAEGMGQFRPHIDGHLLTESFDDAARHQHLADANYMIGCTLDDIRPMGKQIDEFCFLRDSLDHRPAYQYLFARKLPGTHDGAFHSAELWYMFHTLDRSWRPMTSADYRLADEIMDCWTNFAKYGNPNKPDTKNWVPFTLANPYVMTFNVRQADEIQTQCGFTTFGTQLMDATGQPFIIKGINNAHAWFGERAYQALDDIAATRANTLRIVWETRGQADQLERIIKRCIALKMIPMVELHDVTGNASGQELLDVARYYTRNDVKAVLMRYQRYLLINIANEWGDHHVTTEQWIQSYRDVINLMRETGFKTTLVIDAPGWGQNIQPVLEGGSNLIEYDPQHNILFSVHMYGSWNNAQDITEKLSAAKEKNLPLIVGEFGYNHNDGKNNLGCKADHLTIMKTCQRLGYGFMPWSWTGNNKDNAWLDMVDSRDWKTMTQWGREVIDGINGIRQTALPAKVFLEKGN